MIKLYRLLKPYHLFIGLVLVLTLIQALSELYLPTLMADIVNVGIVHGNIPYILKIGGFMLLVAVAGTVSTITAGFFSARIASGFGRMLRERVFAHVESFSLHEFDELGTASLITRTTNDITQLQMLTLFMLRMFVSAPLMSIGGIIMAVSKNPTLSLVLVAAIPILTLTIYRIASRGVPLFKTLQRKIDRLNRVLREELTGIRVTRAFNRMTYEKERFAKANLDLTETSIRVNRTMAMMMPAMMLILNFTTIAILWFGGIRIDRGGMQIGDLMAFLQYVLQIMFSMIMISMMFVMIPRASASAERINAILELDPAIKNPPVTEEASGLRGTLEFRDVIFRYPGAEQPALHHISFRARPGQVTAIIGGTGSGKTTLLNLILRFYDVEKGQILIDSLDIRRLPLEDLREKIGYVPQKSVLFSGTIAENIRYGWQEATDEEVKDALHVAQALPFISELPDGIDTVVSQGGTNLSGGQKQRLAIARALIKKPKIYLFDDSFSALDFKTDSRLRAALRRETEEATVLIVAQRVSTVKDADQILVLDEGRIVGSGTHQELLRTCDEYREIVASQLSEEEIA